LGEFWRHGPRARLLNVQDETADYQTYLDLSNDAQLFGVPVDRAGLALLLILPRASFNVVTPPGSSLALFNIVAPASELENVGGNIGRGLGVCEKNNGDGGLPTFGVSFFPVVKLPASSVCRGLSLGRVLFDGRSEVETARVPLSSDRGCFEAFGVVFESGGLESGRGFRKESSKGSATEFCPLFAVSPPVECLECGGKSKAVFAGSARAAACCCCCNLVGKPVSLSIPP
jgi:hypothetical protein